MAHIVSVVARPMATHRSLRRFTLSSGPVDLKLETDLWSALANIAAEERIPLAALIDLIDQQRGGQSLTRALWRFSITYLRYQTDDAATRAASLPPIHHPALKPVG